MKMSVRSSRRARIALIQMKMAASPEANLKKAIQLADQARKKGAQIVVLPELFATPYFPAEEAKKYYAFAETFPGPSTQTFADWAKKNKAVVVVPFFEKRAAGLYHNSAAVIDADGRMLGLYRKMHIPDDPHFYEKYYFAPGDLGFRVFKTRFGNLAVLICWDQWYPEGARAAALAGADLLVYPTAIGWLHDEDREAKPRQKAAWRTVQTSHAITNGVFVAAANRVGKEKRATFWGGSFVTGPDGHLLAEAGTSEEKALLCDLDFSKIEKIRQEWPFLRDRRVDAYKPLLSRYHAA